MTPWIAGLVLYALVSVLQEMVVAKVYEMQGEPEKRSWPRTVFRSIFWPFTILLVGFVFRQVKTRYECPIHGHDCDHESPPPLKCDHCDKTQARGAPLGAPGWYSFDLGAKWAEPWKPGDPVPVDSDENPGYAEACCKEHLAAVFAVKLAACEPYTVRADDHGTGEP